MKNRLKFYIAQYTALILFVLPINIFAQKEVQILNRQTFQFPSWEKAVETTDVEKYTTADEYKSVVLDNTYVLEKLQYKSNGLSVPAYLYHPVKESMNPRPIIVFNRGSFIRGEIAPELIVMFHRLAEDGFTIVAPLYRGSAGAEGRDEMGGADLDDLMNVTKVFDELKSVDTENVYLYGESRGGMMVFQAIRDGFPAKAAATFGGFTDLAGLTSSEQGKAMANSIWPDFEKNREQIIERRSAIHWPEKLNVPLLLMSGSEDGAVSPTQTLRLGIALAKEHKDFGIIIFPGANHIIAPQQAKRDREAVEFFKRYITNGEK